MNVTPLAIFLNSTKEAGERGDHPGENGYGGMGRKSSMIVFRLL